MRKARSWTLGVVSVQGGIGTVRQEILTIQNRIERFESATGVPLDVQNDLRRQAAHDRTLVEPMQQREQELGRQETELFNALNAEQARWAEFNGRVDEIDRSLSATEAR